MYKQIKTKIEYPYHDTKNRFANNYQKFNYVLALMFFFKMYFDFYFS